MKPFSATVLSVVTTLAGGSAVSAQDVVINEFQYDDSGTDDREFVELYNAGATPVDISGWVLDANDQVRPSDNGDYTIPAGSILQPGAFFVVGGAAVPNVHFVAGTTDLWENSQETIELYDASGTLIDAVAYEVNKGVPDPSGQFAPAVAAKLGEGIWGNLVSVDAYPTSWSRNRDGVTTNNNGRDFRLMPETPGASNDYASLMPLVENFDALPVGQDVPDWGASFVPPKVVDPTQTSSGGNPSPIPASPQGGNALQFWDSVGGGNAAMLLGDAVGNVVLECYVYCDATPEAAGDYESWSIGVRGTTATYYNSPDPAGTFGFTANGNTGVSVTYQCTDQGATLSLVDHGDGGWASPTLTNARVLGVVPVTPGVNDGWQRVRLHVGTGYAEMRFGGTYGQLDGSHVGGPTYAGAPGGIYLGYRENLPTAGIAAANPLTLDFLVVRDGIADVEYLGDATPNSVGTPAIAPSEMPNLGVTAWSLDVSGLAPNDLLVALLGVSTPAAPLNLEPLGAQTGSRVYIDIAVGVTLQANANGEAALQLQLPAIPSLSGATLYAQAIEVDQALSASLPIAQTAAIACTLGN